jgi:hypothetical protein
MGIVDFDTLDGVDEFLDACDLVGLRGSAGVETRVFVPEFATREINSPGEPGVCYQMGVGFATGQPDDRAADILADLRQRSSDRVQDMLAHINAYLAPVTIDYALDVLPLTPKGNATERHVLAAYVTAAERIFPEHVDRVRFWATKLGLEDTQVETLMHDLPGFKNSVRARLMKRGGVGYISPDPNSFPVVEVFHEMIVRCGALPCFAWLDGTSEGERDIEELLASMIEGGTVAVNVIPDRNWNIVDSDVKRVKVQNLYAFVRLAQDLDLPLNIGTEMNKRGLKLVDDLDVPELAPVRQAFLDGAHFVYGHTVMQRILGLGYQGEWARDHFPARRERNEFYTRVGYHVPPGKEGRRRLERCKEEPPPADILAA